MDGGFWGGIKKGTSKLFSDLILLFIYLEEVLEKKYPVLSWSLKSIAKILYLAHLYCSRSELISLLFNLILIFLYAHDFCWSGRHL